MGLLELWRMGGNGTTKPRSKTKSEGNEFTAPEALGLSDDELRSLIATWVTRRLIAEFIAQYTASRAPNRDSQTHHESENAS